MPKDNPRTGYEAFQWEYIILYVGFGILLLGWNLFSYYTPVWSETLGPQGIWIAIGFFVTVGGLGILGLAATFRHHTRKLIAGNKMFQLAFPKPITLDAEYYPINESQLTSISSRERSEMELARKVIPGTNALGQKVRISALLPGGIDAHGFKSLSGGSQGMILLYGDDQMINLDQCVFIPHILEARDHTEIPVEALTVAEAQSHFVRGKMPIYTVGALDPGVHTWLTISPVAQSTVLQSIGYEGMVERFAARLARLIASGKLPELSVVGSGGRRTLPQPLMDAITTEFHTWLTNQKALEVAMGNGHAGLEYWRHGYFSLLSERNLLQARLRIKDHTIYENEKAFSGRADNRSRVWSNQPPSPGPAYDLNAARPVTTNQE